MTAPRTPPSPLPTAPIGRNGRIAYAAMASGLVFYVLTLWIQVFIDTRKAGTVSVDPCSEAHRHWRLRSTLLYLIWTVLGILTVPLGVGWLIVIPAWLWYAARTVRGAWRFGRGLPPPGRRAQGLRPAAT